MCYELYKKKNSCKKGIDKYVEVKKLFVFYSSFLKRTVLYIYIYYVYFQIYQFYLYFYNY